MSQTTAVSVPAPSAGGIARPASPPAQAAAAVQIAGRALRKYFRTPGLFAMAWSRPRCSCSCSAMSSAVPSAPARPGRPATSSLGTWARSCCSPAAGSRSPSPRTRPRDSPACCCPCPSPRSALAAGRTLADFTTNGWSIIFTAAPGFAVGFRLPSSAADGLTALGLCLLYGLVFTVVFLVIGVFAPNTQAAQGMSMIAFVLAFISSAYVSPSSMPGWLQPFARYQPVTPMVNAVHAAPTGGTHDLAAALIWSAALIIAFMPIAVIGYRRA